MVSDSAGPLPEPMLLYLQWDPLIFIQGWYLFTISVPKLCWKCTHLKSQPHLPRHNELMCWCAMESRRILCVHNQEFTSVWWRTFPDIKVHGANMGPTWILSAPDGPRVGPMNLAFSVVSCQNFPYNNVALLISTMTHTPIKPETWLNNTLLAMEIYFA